MSAYYTHNLELNREEVVHHGASDYLVLVDLDSYPTFVGKKSDRLDLMAHLQNQRAALTAVAWEAPEKPVNLRFLLTHEQDLINRLGRPSSTAFAGGSLRTSGRIVFTGHERLFDCAHDPGHDILKGRRLSKENRPRVFNVPPGMLYVSIYEHFLYPDRDNLSHIRDSDERADYTVVLHHYPPPAPRLRPVRLPGFVLPLSLRSDGENEANLATSHKNP